MLQKPKGAEKLRKLPTCPALLNFRSQVFPKSLKSWHDTLPLHVKQAFLGREYHELCCFPGNPW